MYLDTSPLLGGWSANVSSQPAACPSILLACSFEEQILSTLMRPDYLFCFFFSEPSFWCSVWELFAYI